MHLFEFILFLSVGFCVRLLPLRFAGTLGEALGRIVFRFTQFRKRITLDNLRHAFPNESELTLQSIAGNAFETMGASLLEFMWSPRLTRRMCIRRSATKRR